MQLEQAATRSIGELPVALPSLLKRQTYVRRLPLPATGCNCKRLILACGAAATGTSRAWPLVVRLAVSGGLSAVQARSRSQAKLPILLDRRSAGQDKADKHRKSQTWLHPYQQGGSVAGWSSDETAGAAFWPPGRRVLQEILAAKSPAELGGVLQTFLEEKRPLNSATAGMRRSFAAVCGCSGRGSSMSSQV